MKKIVIILIVSIVIILSAALTYYLPESILQDISNISTFVTLAATIIGLVIAMILYNQLGLDQAILQKKSEVVFKLLDLLNERNFTIMTNIGYHPLVWLSSISRSKEGYNKYGHIKLLFNDEYIDCILPIMNLIDNVFLPTEILPMVQALTPTAFYKQNEKVIEPEFGKVVITGQRLVTHVGEANKRNLDKNDWGILLFNNGSITDLTLSQFIDQWDDLIITTTNWIAQNSSYQDLNIPFFREYHYQTPKRSIWKKMWDWLMADAFLKTLEINQCTFTILQKAIYNGYTKMGYLPPCH